MKNLILTFSLICFFTLANVVNSDVLGQELPLRIGIKVGYPQVAGLNLEYVTPLLNKRLAADLDLSYIPLSRNTTTVTYTNFALFANYYFSHEGRGLYGGLGFSRMGFDVTKDVTFSGGTTQKGKANLGINSLNLKIGGKHGKSFYFRWELGWSLGLSSPAFEVVATNNGVTKNESFTSPIKGSGPIADIGFGFAF
jgi:hypothetical protein